MYSNNIALPVYPEWYKIEKETEKTISKLSSLRELSFYLRNPDEYIRRLAIIRIADIKLKDAIEILKETLDDRVESQINKELAAWAIKVISHKWDIDLFISHKLLNKYSGSERSIDINKVTFSDGDTSVKFEFTASLINSELKLDNEDFRHSEDIDFDMPFSIKEWFSVWSQEFLSAAKNVFINLPGLLIKFIKISAVFIVKNLIIKLFKAAWNGISQIHTRYKSRPKKQTQEDIFEARRYGRSSYIEKTDPIRLIKTVLYKLAYIILSPVRLVLKHRMFSVATFLAIYLLLAYTTYGKIITYKYAGLDLAETQSHVYNSAKELLGYAGNEIKGIFSIDPSSNTINGAVDNEPIETAPQTTRSTAEEQLQYRVTAKTGLNVRKEPNAASGKVPTKLLTYNATVKYLGKSQTDSSGKLWHLIQTPDGKTGWAYSKWLEKVRGDNNASK